MRGGRALLAATATLALVSVALVAEGAITWTTTAGALHVGVAPAPLRFEAGDGTTNARYVKDFALTTNETGFTATLKSRAGAELSLDDVVRIRNADDETRTVTLSAQQVDASYHSVFEWSVRDGGTLVATFDHLGANPSASFAIPPAAVYELDLRVEVKEGGGKNNARVPFGLGLGVS